MEFTERFKSILNDRVFLEEKMQDIELKNHYVGSFIPYDEVRATYELIIEKNVISAKNLYFEASQVVDYLVKKRNIDPFNPIKFTFYAILSDSNLAIERMLTYKATPATEKISAFQVHFGYALQAILKGDMEEVEKRVLLARQKAQKGLFKRYVGALKVFEGILMADLNIIEAGLLDFLKENRNSDLLGAEFMDLQATGLAKLAWRKGFEVEVNSELIPMLILPCEELNNYDSFDFFIDPEIKS